MRTNYLRGNQLARQPAQEFLLVHAVFEGFATVNENHRDFVVELATKLGVRVNVDLLPNESSAARELGQALFDHFTQVASLAGVDHNIARLWHAGRF
jgi:hypothetical protein